jgi:hypothetical protein
MTDGQHHVVSWLPAGSAASAGSSDVRRSSLPEFVIEYAVALQRIWAEVEEPAAWVASAAGSGVVGNFIYDMLMKSGRWHRGRHWRNSESIDSRAAHTIAILAVRTRCAENDLPSPPARTLRVAWCRPWLVSDRHCRNAVGWEVFVVGGDGELTAVVWVPDEPQLVNKVRAVVNIAR